jgi:hypothetical protein
MPKVRLGYAHMKRNHGGPSMGRSVAPPGKGFASGKDPSEEPGQSHPRVRAREGTALKAACPLRLGGTDAAEAQHWCIFVCAWPTTGQ